jgi:hypothetical protein
MKIKLLSDLHHEFQPSGIEQDYFEYTGEDVLVLAGDIASGSTNTIDVIKQFKKSGYQNIVYVPGNHEYYGTDTRDFDSKMLVKCSRLDGVHFLNPSHVKIGDTIFVGGALWTDFRGNSSAKDSAQCFIADFRLIKHFSPEHAVLLFEKHLAYIKSICRQFPGEKKVIVTHFLPTLECIHPRWQKETSLLNYYFANNLGEWVETLENTTWLFGHTHDSIDVTVGSTRLIANPYGYWGKGVNPHFKHALYV